MDIRCEVGDASDLQSDGGADGAIPILGPEAPLQTRPRLQAPVGASLTAGARVRSEPGRSGLLSGAHSSIYQLDQHPGQPPENHRYRDIHLWDPQYPGYRVMSLGRSRISDDLDSI
ncbi:MAG: hypothetical protein M8353_08005 [ANME-2 cluster archaeon]|nr:hypothetical protein [ANME-2 cluster archaeon]